VLWVLLEGGCPQPPMLTFNIAPFWRVAVPSHRCSMHHSLFINAQIHKRTGGQGRPPSKSQEHRRIGGRGRPPFRSQEHRRIGGRGRPPSSSQEHRRIGGRGRPPSSRGHSAAERFVNCNFTLKMLRFLIHWYYCCSRKY